MKKIIALLLVLAMALSLVACGGSSEAPKADAPAAEAPAAEAPAAEAPAEAVTIKVAAIETAYGSQVWADVAAAFEAETGIKVELTTDKNLEDVLTGPMQNGEFPDVVHLAPMFYSPCGLFYNAKLFEEKGWEVPTTWDEMWALGDVAAAEGIALFTYPTTGYFDTFIPNLIASVGGTELWESISNYEEGIWDTAEGQKVLDVIAKLATYVHPNTPAQANNQDFTKNQLMVMTNDALFMPNGTWITGEMRDAEATLENEFAWGMTAQPGFDASAVPYAYCWFEQAWIPAAAEHIAEAEQFVAFLYSDKAAEIFAAVGAIQPIVGVAESLEGENKVFYSIYDNGANACMGNFQAFGEIPGVTVADTFFAPIDSLVSGTITIEDYAELVKTNSDLMREAKLG